MKETKLCSSCGVEKTTQEFRTSDILNNNRHICIACLSETRKKHRQTASGILSVLKSSAKARGLEFSLESPWFVAWWTEQSETCCYCGISIQDFIELRKRIVSASTGEFPETKYKKFFYRPAALKVSRMTIERRDNSLGYSPSNIAKCCSLCNSLKGELFDEEEMLVISAETRRDFHDILRKPNG